MKKNIILITLFLLFSCSSDNEKSLSFEKEEENVSTGVVLDIDTKENNKSSFVENSDYLIIEDWLLYCEFWDEDNKNPEDGYYYSKQKIDIIENPFLLEEINYSLVKDDKNIYSYGIACDTWMPASCSCGFSKLDLDINTFELLDDYYYRDKNNLFIHWNKVIWLNINSLIFLKDIWESWKYFKDKNSIFYYDEKIIDIDYDSFIVVDGEYAWEEYDAKDKNSYFKYWRNLNIDSSKIKQEAIFTNNILLCNDLIQEKDIESCKKNIDNNLESKAIKNNDILLCEEVINTELCKDKIYMNLVSLENDMSYCWKMNNFKDDCYSLFYKTWWCEYIKSEIDKNNCFIDYYTELYSDAVETDNYKQCLLLKEWSLQYDLCKRKIVANSKNIVVCSSVYELDKWMWGICFKNLAIREKDKTICNNIDDKWFSDMCIKDFNNYSN